MNLGVRDACLILVVIVACVFANGLTTPYMFDDVYWIRDNPAIRTLWPLSSARRPLGYYSLQLDYAVHGNGVFGYHAVNIAIHAAAAVVLCLLVRETLKLGRFSKSAVNAKWFAFAVALLWAVHPLQTSSVTYIIQRFESLMGLGFLLCLYGVLRGATSEGRSSRWMWYAVAWLAYCGSIASKEIAAVCPLVVLLFDRAFLAGNWRGAMKQRWPLYLAFLPPLAWLAMTMRGTLGDDGTNAGFGYEGVTPWEYLRSQGGVILHYLRLSFWPDSLCLDYGWPVATSPLAIYLPGAIVLALLLAAAWALWKQPALGFLGMSFFLILAPTSSFMPIADLAFEHRMYLPLAVVVILALLVLNWLLAKKLEDEAARRKWFLVITGCCAAALSVRTAVRNLDYSSPYAMWAKVARQNRHNARAHTNLAFLLDAVGKKAEAVQHLEAAMQETPKYARAYSFRADMLAKQGETAAAIKLYREALQIHPRYITAHLHLAKVLLIQKKDYAGTLAAAHAVQQIDPASREAAKLIARVRATAVDPKFQNPAEAVELLLANPPLPGQEDKEWQELLAVAQKAEGSGVRRQESAKATSRATPTSLTPDS
ncbi:MAG: tetratricopeptide repeat protein [Planctomycetales bacterium]|nr:tetratricopeptide repeat protein [Planctomycetales bacterium]